MTYDCERVGTPIFAGARHAVRGANWPTALASLAVSAAFLALWFCLLPPWLGFQADNAGAAHWRWIAAVPSLLGFAVALVAVAVVALFVRLYEGPTLRKIFGADYAEHCRNVPRWIPRISARG